MEVPADRPEEQIRVGAEGEHGAPRVRRERPGHDDRECRVKRAAAIASIHSGRSTGRSSRYATVENRVARRFRPFSAPSTRDLTSPRTTTERPAGLRSPGLGRIADARRQAAVRVDDSALRSRPLQRLAGQPAEEGPLGGDARVARRRHQYLHRSKFDPATLPALLEGHRPPADRHPAPARLRRDDVRPHGAARCAACRRSCTSTRTSPTRPGSRRWPIARSSRSPTSRSRCRGARPTSCIDARLHSGRARSKSSTWACRSRSSAARVRRTRSPRRAHELGIAPTSSRSAR